MIGVLRLEAWIQVGVGLIDTIKASLDDAGMLQVRALVALESLVNIWRIGSSIFGQTLLSGQQANSSQILCRVRLVDWRDEGRLSQQAIVLIVVQVVVIQ